MTLSLDRQIHYPDSNGQPIAENTRQFRWIVLLKENLECLFANDPHGHPFVTTLKLAQQLQFERQRATQEAERAGRLAAYLRSQGIDPDQV